VVVFIRAFAFPKKQNLRQKSRPPCCVQKISKKSATLQFTENIDGNFAETIQLGRVLRKFFDTAYFETLVRFCNFVKE